jgi:hypothetical protein
VPRAHRVRLAKPVLRVRPGGLLDTATLNGIQSNTSSLSTRQADFADFSVNTTSKTVTLTGYNVTVAALSLQGDSVSTASGGAGYLAPSAGTTNQVLAKSSNSDGAFQWKT